VEADLAPLAERVRSQPSSAATVRGTRTPGEKSDASDRRSRSAGGSTASTLASTSPAAARSCGSAQLCTTRAPRTSASISSSLNMSGGRSYPRGSA